MPHRKHEDERWALRLLEKIVERSRQDRDALPGSVVGLVKRAAVVLRRGLKGKVQTPTLGDFD
jgi:hypothetical protein